MRTAVVAMIGGVAAVMAVDARPVANRQIPSITGRVVDTGGSPLPGVVVTTIPSSGGVTARVHSGTDGTYRFESLPEGSYRVDFDIAGFDVIRRNRVQVTRTATARADATLPISSICECVSVVMRETLRERSGQVVDESGQPLPHARLEIVSPARREVRFADDQGRFRLRAPIKTSWPLTASDSGFGAVSQQVSGTQSDVVIRLIRSRTAGVPETERLTRGCRCPGDLFTHDGR